MIRLDAGSLGTVGAAVAVPGFDRDAVSVGIVHFGVGGFHRSHQAVYTDDVLSAGEREWGICGVGTQPADLAMAESLREQDCLYTLVVKHPDGQPSARVIGSLLEFLHAPDDPEAVLRRLADPAVRIVSLTITEGGYPVDQATGEFAPLDPGLLLDLQPATVPTTVFGLIAAGLRRRREAGIAPFTVLSCDNVHGNGDVARTSVLGVAAAHSGELADWVSREVAFPNSMVDRITPMTTDEDRALLAERFGVSDARPVVCEPFTQWVLEDRFPAGRPPWETVGATLVADVGPFELVKLRLLNAGHQVMGYLGYLAGLRYVDEIADDGDLGPFVSAYLIEEALPSLPPAAAGVAAGYPATLMDRFANTEVRDTLARLCSEGSDRVPTFLLPVIRDRLAAGGDISRSTLAVAAWARYAEGIDETGSPIVVVDRLLESVQDAAARQRQEPTAFLTGTGLFGELADSAVFTHEFVRSLASLHARGARASVRELAVRG